MGEREEKKRSTIITVICVLGFIVMGSSALNLLTALMREEWSSFHTYFAVIVTLTLAAFVGMWQMRKWGVVLYALTAAVNSVLVWLVWGYPLAGVLVGALIAAAVVAIGVSQFRKMD